MHTPVWYGVGSALQREVEAGRLDLLRSMYQSWPFFQSTVELVEAVLAKVTPRSRLRLNVREKERGR